MTRLVRVMVAKSRMKIFRQRVQRILDYYASAKRVRPAREHRHTGGVVYDTADAGYAVNGERIKRAHAVLDKVAGAANIAGSTT